MDLKKTRQKEVCKERQAEKKKERKKSQIVLTCVINTGIGIDESSIAMQPHTSPTGEVMGVFTFMARAN